MYIVDGQIEDLNVLHMPQFDADYEDILAVVRNQLVAGQQMMTVDPPSRQVTPIRRRANHF